MFQMLQEHGWKGRESICFGHFFVINVDFNKIIWTCQLKYIPTSSYSSRLITRQTITTFTKHQNVIDLIGERWVKFATHIRKLNQIQFALRTYMFHLPKTDVEESIYSVKENLLKVYDSLYLPKEVKSLRCYVF